MLTTLETSINGRTAVALQVPTGPWVEVIEHPASHIEHLTGLVPAWENLAASALEPNVFFEPALILPALRMHPKQRNVLFVLVWVPDRDPKKPPRLGAFFPLERLTRYKILPVPALRFWEYGECFLYTPLVRKDCAHEALAAFLDWLAADSRSCPLLEMQLTAGEGPVYQHLIDLFRLRGTLTMSGDQFTRAFYRNRDKSDAYLQAALPGDKRREMNRRQRKLGELGKTEFRYMEKAADLDAWLEAFLKLEASGWKGKQGTALLNYPEKTLFIKDACRELLQRGKLLLNGLWLNDQPIAMRMTFLSGPGGFFYKPAYDESYAKFAPGVLLEVECVQYWHKHATLRWTDSCTSPENQMLNNLWLDRMVCQNLIVATGRRWSHLAISILPLLRWFNRLLGGYKLPQQ